MAQVRCEFCHESVDRSKYQAHVKRHLEKRPDGQQSEYLTLPPEERTRGPLRNVPTVYVHERCGSATGMPDEIVRSYLVNPYLYLADRTFCTGCGRHVPNAECVWTETGENLQTYFDRLRAAKPEMRPGPLKRLLVAVLKRIA